MFVFAVAWAWDPACRCDGPTQLQVAKRRILYCCVKEVGADDVIIVIALRSDLLAMVRRVLQGHTQNCYH
jgi:hypothetical protein